MATIIRNAVLSKNAAKLLYKLINGLLYFDDIEYNYSLRLYLLATLEYKVFQKAYNKIGYPSYTRTYKKLIYNIYIFNISTKLYKYLRYYLYY